MLADPSLVEDGVGGVARLYVLVNDESAVRDRAEPDLMIAFALPFESASVSPKETLDLGGERRRHHEASGTRSWRWLVNSNAIESLETSPESKPLASSNSGIIVRSVLARTSIVSASVTKPGTSGLVATQRPASASQSAST